MIDLIGDSGNCWLPHWRDGCLRATLLEHASAVQHVEVLQIGLLYLTRGDLLDWALAIGRLSVQNRRASTPHLVCTLRLDDFSSVMLL